jgi:hypothetical protein
MIYWYAISKGKEIQPPQPKYPTSNPISQAPFFTFSALAELLPLSPDPKIKQKSALVGPIPNFKIHRGKIA